MAALMLGTGSLTASRSSFAGTRSRIQGEAQAAVGRSVLSVNADLAGEAIRDVVVTDEQTIPIQRFISTAAHLLLVDAWMHLHASCQTALVRFALRNGQQSTDPTRSGWRISFPQYLNLSPLPRPVMG